MLPETLGTARLRLRPPAVADAEAIFERYAQDPAVTRYLLWAPHQSLTETREFLASFETRAEGSHLTRTWVLAEADDTAIGMLGAWERASFMLEVGYVLAPSRRGRGLMAEALTAVIAAALAVPSIHRVFATSHIDNVASVRVQEKAGMQFEGTLRRARVFPNLGDAPCDERIYAVVRE